MDQSYRCHLRRRIPDLLYQLWFYVSVPGTDSMSSFETPRQHVEVRPPTVATMAPSSTDEMSTRAERTVSNVVTSSLASGRTTIEFVHIEYDAIIDLPNEIILAGRKSNDGGSSSRWSHVVEGQQRPVSDSDAWSGDVEKMSENVYVAAVNFDKPFGYSTSTWVQGQNASI